MFRFLLVCALAVVALGCATGRSGSSGPIPVDQSRTVATEPVEDPELSAIVEAAARQAVETAGNGDVAIEEVWATVIDLRGASPRIGSWQGSEPVYPASVVKLCYLVAAHHQVSTGQLAMDAALREDLHAMITVSDNKATNRVLDRLTGTEFGETLSEEEFADFAHRRQEVHRYMSELGLPGLWATNKTFDEDIRLYGRDRQWLGARKGDNFERSNMMTTGETARLLYLIQQRAVVSPEACEEMLALMNRKVQPATIFSEVIPTGATLYSKDGNTDICWHDAGIVELADGGTIIVVVFTKTRHEEGPRPRVAEETCRALVAHLGN